MAIFQERFKEARIAKGITQYTIATHLGVTRSAVGMYETGVREPSLEKLIAIADLFDVTTDPVRTR